jgi:hypothetical protein
MMIDAKCSVCKNPDVRRGVESMWNNGMSQAAIARVVGDKLTTPSITKHLKEHSDGDGNARRVEIEPELPVRERILNLQRMQLDEVERRIGLAKTRADLMNAEREKLTDANGNPFPPIDWSEFTDILGKDMQSAIGSILKTQGLSDKREKAVADTQVGLFAAMANAGLAPKALVGETTAIAMLEAGDADDDAD